MYTHRSHNRASAENIRTLIEKHQYFKNPSTHAIRLTAIMKYLKKKGVELNFYNADLYVDCIIQSIHGVTKVDHYKYYKSRNGK